MRPHSNSYAKGYFVLKCLLKFDNVDVALNIVILPKTEYIIYYENYESFCGNYLCGGKKSVGRKNFKNN